MARKNPKIFRQNGDGPDQKGLRSPACGAELPRFRVDKDGSQGDRLTPTRCTRPQGRVRIETSALQTSGSSTPKGCTRPQGRVIGVNYYCRCASIILAGARLLFLPVDLLLKTLLSCPGPIAGDGT